MKWWDRIVERFQRGIEEEDLELEWDGSSIESWDWETLLKDRDMLKMTDDYERQKFAEKLLSMPDIRTCPHGRPVMIEMTRREMEKSFGRV